jgi:hypothetical protein
MGRDPLAHVAQVGPGVDPVRLAPRHDAIEDGRASPPDIAAAEEPVLPARDDPSQRAFGRIVVDGERAVLRGTASTLSTAPARRSRLPDRALRQHHADLLVQPRAEALEHPERAEGVPATGRSDAALEVEVDATRMDAVEPPPAVGLPLGPHDLDGLRHPGIWVRARAAEVIERAQHVVASVVREREVEIRRIGDLARALAAEQAALEQVLLPVAAGLAHRGRTPRSRARTRAARQAR